MKFIKNQNGYALLIVLLMVVLFLGLSATFMAGSLSNAKQEKTVDTSNQAVASAEMGVKYFSTDLQKELKIITKEVSGKTLEKLLDLRECFKNGNADCDNQVKITAKEALIDEEMKNLYVTKIIDVIRELEIMAAKNPSEKEIKPFTSDGIVYSIQSASSKSLNQHGEDVTSAGVTDTKISFIEVRLALEGESNGISKTLEAKFNIEVPPTFLNNSNPLTVYTEKLPDKVVSYDDIFKPKPEISCTELLALMENPLYDGLIECSLKGSETMTKILADIKAAGLDPRDFTLYTDSFLTNVCPSSGNVCTKDMFEGIKVAVSGGDISAPHNMNNLSGANFIINGMWAANNNIQNLGKNDLHQTIVTQEIQVSKNFTSMVNTNLILLGKNEIAPVSRAIFNLHVNGGENGKNKGFNIGETSRFCIDIDKFEEDDLDYIKENFTFTSSETSEGLLIFYSRDKDKKFTLTDLDNNESDEVTAERQNHVLPEPDYTTFLKACGLTIEDRITDMTDVSIVDNLDPGFDLDVEY